MGKRCRAVGRDGAAWRLAKGWRCGPGGFGGRGCGRRCRPAVGSGADIASRPRLASACTSKKTYKYTPFFLHVHTVKTTCTSRKTCMYIPLKLHVHLSSSARTCLIVHSLCLVAIVPRPNPRTCRCGSRLWRAPSLKMRAGGTAPHANKKNPLRGSSLWCHQESNRGHKDFQSFALPTELWHQIF